MEDDFSKFRLITGIATVEKNLPVIVLPEKKNVSEQPVAISKNWILGIVLVILMLLLMATLAISEQQTRHHAAHSELISRMQMHHLHLSRVAQQALMGNASAFTQLQDSQRQLNQYIDLLSQGGGYRNLKIAPLSDLALSLSLDAYHSHWQHEQKQINVILNHQDSLIKLGNNIRAISITQSQLIKFIDELIHHMQQIGNLSHEIRGMEALKSHVRNITRNVNTILPNEFLMAEIAKQLAQDYAQIAAITQNLIQGNNALISVANKNETIQDLLSHVHALLRKFDDHMNMIQKEISAVLPSKLAIHEIANKNEAILSMTSELDDEIQEHGLYVDSIINALIYILGAGVALTLIFFAKLLQQSSRNQALASKHEVDKTQKAIHKLLSDMRKIADGDLTVRTNVTHPTTGAIADAINYTIEELHTLVEQVNQATALVVKSSDQAQYVSSGLLNAAQQQSFRIEETTLAVVGMMESITEISDLATESARVAKQSLMTAEKGTTAVRESIAGMNEIRTHIQDTSKRIKRLGESSQEIGEIVALITDITDQTNVLALNVALQATAAGEAGHGFTVIAQEVQRLAERSAEASKQISELIVTIQGDTQDAIEAMERSTLGVAKGTKRSDAAGRALEEIEEVSKQLAQLVANIFDITHTQTQTANTVVANMEEILHITRQNTQGTLQTTASIRQITGFASELKASVSNFKV
ncbi:MAG TPA: methyl-accepting chemotaxis protein [Nitrosomonas sp.]|nr:methyl-accepting chemotaxis protein [Nitrosomonas sp.]HRB98256.1 methyl-accepting chemotaxis protein [Nitrosomonas sp.]